MARDLHYYLAAGTASTASTAAPQQLDLIGLAEAIEAANRKCERQARALRELFAENGYDLANGDVLYHAADLALDVPPQYRAQVQSSPLVPSGQIVFTKNPRFSLF
jgi:hypothetical protein